MMKFAIGQQVRTTKTQEWNDGFDSGGLPKGSVGLVIAVIEEYEGYHVEFGSDHNSDVWAVLENELEAMESEK